MAEGRGFTQQDTDVALVEVSIYVNTKEDSSEVNEATLQTLIENAAKVAVDRAVTQTAAIEAKPEDATNVPDTTVTTS